MLWHFLVPNHMIFFGVWFKIGFSQREKKEILKKVKEDEVISGKVYDNEIANDSNRNVEEKI